MGISASWKVCVYLFSVISPPAGPHCTPAGRLLQTHPGRSLLFPDCPQRAPQGARGSVLVDESLAPRAVCRPGAWPRQTPVRICSFTRARVGRLHDECEEREPGQTGLGRGHSCSHPQGDRNAGHTPPPLPLLTVHTKLTCASIHVM